MAETDPQVLEFARTQLERQPDLGSRALYELAQQADPSVGELSQQQYHGRYYLAARRAVDPPKEKRPRAPKRNQPERKAGKGSGRSKTGQSAESETPTNVETPTRAEKPAQGQPTEHAQVRSLFLEFAQKFAEAESRSEIVRVLTQVDDYVDRVVGQKQG